MCNCLIFTIVALLVSTTTSPLIIVITLIISFITLEAFGKDHHTAAINITAINMMTNLLKGRDAP